ncbi:MAG: hypothetical protein C5B55_14940 [Blastocatellia bacterium]|nr:MAG: hypothetical protein C5B55_14940 [Blastocatellia bacterium]
MSSRSSTQSLSIVQLVLSAGAVALLVSMFFAAARFGFSRLLTRYALVTNSIPAANQAVSLTPSDADARRARASLLANAKLFTEATRDLQIATNVRQGDDYLWLELGLNRDELGDTQGAYKALDQAVQHAPFYAHTLWQRGNILLRLGRFDAAFDDLSRAAESNRAFLPNVIDLAWSLSHEDPNETAQLAKIDTDYERVFFTRFLASKGKGPETLVQFRLNPTAFSPEQKKDVIRQLMTTNAYRDAFEIWKTDAAITNERFPMIYDGGFEGSLAFNEVGFGWYVKREQSPAALSLDTAQHQSGDKSLRVTFNGDSDPGLPIISQTILIRPQTHYRITFAVKTSDIVSGGLPYLNLKDAATGMVFAKSPAFPQRTADWQLVSFEATTAAGTEAVVLSLQRNSCSGGPCPIFGSVWLDSFSIEQLAQ